MIKSQMIPILVKPCFIIFACSMKHNISKNILRKKEFVSNIINNDIAEKVCLTTVSYPWVINEIKEAGLTPITSIKVKIQSIIERI